jgi:TPR repeat protein
MSNKAALVSVLAACGLFAILVGVVAMHAVAAPTPGRATAVVSADQADAPPWASAPIPSEDAKCSTCDGFRLMSMGEYARAIDIFQRRAAEGDPAAMDDLAWMYEQGLGVPADVAQAFRLYMKAASLNDSTGQMSVGNMYMRGAGAPADVGQAMKYLRLSADNGNADALTELGKIYQHGMAGVPVDYAQAMVFYRKAAPTGSSDAMNQIGFMFEHGLGVTANQDTAWCWYQWSSVQGNGRADEHLAEFKAAGRVPPPSCEVLNQTP